MTTAGDAFGAVIEAAVERAVRKVLNRDEVTKRRMLSVDEAAEYLGLGPREIYNMLEDGSLGKVKRGKRTLVDIRDLDNWIARSKG